jgi:hypothetical protein
LELNLDELLVSLRSVLPPHSSSLISRLQVGNVDVSPASFASNWSTHDPIQDILNTHQQAALDKFHLRLCRRLLLIPGIAVFNGSGARKHLLNHLLLDEGIDTIVISFYVTDRQGYRYLYSLTFSRLKDAPIESSHLYLTRPHPQGCDERFGASLQRFITHVRLLPSSSIENELT